MQDIDSWIIEAATSHNLPFASLRWKKVSGVIEDLGAKHVGSGLGLKVRNQELQGQEIYVLA